MSRYLSNQHETICPLCGTIIAVRRLELVEIKDIIVIEERVKLHLATHHARRYKMWKRLGSRTTWPWRRLIVG